MTRKLKALSSLQPFGLSVPRNEKLANVFYRLKLIEAYGTGIPKILRSYNDCARKPEIQTSSNAFKVILPNRNASIHIPVSSKDTFTDNEKKIISMLERQGEIARKDIENTLSVSQANAVRILRKLSDKGVIRVIGEGKNTRYRKASNQVNYGGINTYAAEPRTHYMK